jgi:hypothetical protein
VCLEEVSAGPPAALVAQGDGAADRGRDGGAAHVQRQAGTGQRRAELLPAQEGGEPPGPDSRSTAVPMIARSSISLACAVSGAGPEGQPPAAGSAAGLGAAQPGPRPARVTHRPTRSSSAPGLTSPVTTGITVASQATARAAGPSSHAAPSPPDTDAAARAAAHRARYSPIHRSCSTDPASRARSSASETWASAVTGGAEHAQRLTRVRGRRDSSHLVRHLRSGARGPIADYDLIVLFTFSLLLE